MMNILINILGVIIMILVITILVLVVIWLFQLIKESWDDVKW